MPALNYATDGTEQGPCPPGYLYFGPKNCCSGKDCRPGPELAARLPNRNAAPTTIDYQRPTLKRIVYLFGAETTGGTAQQLDGDWATVQAQALGFGWHGDVAIVQVTVDRDWGEELRRDVIGHATI